MKTKNYKLKSVKCKACNDALKVLKIKRPIFCSEICRYFYDEKNRSKKAGKNHPGWKGGRIVAWNGYIRLRFPDHPRALSNGYVWEHIVVAEKKIGRSLYYFGKGNLKNENVHHIDGDKTNNNPKNLMIFSSINEHLKHEWQNNPEVFPQSGISKKRFEDWKRKNKGFKNRKCNPKTQGGL